jgi:ribonuclease D
LKPELEAKGRLAWHQEACARLISESSQWEPADLDSVWRVKGSHLLGRPALAVLRELWQWRETEAVGANRPPYFIMSHEALIDIAAAGAMQRPIDPFLPKTMSERRRAGVSKAIAAGLGVSADRHPKIMQRINRRPTEAERKRFLELEKRRNHRAGELDIDPTLIASRATLSDLAQNWDKHAADLMQWQLKLVQA